ncbi:MAG: ROK family protein [Planctomycetota bacterium]|nr:ROK family protein [Planctomycetota bacterium]MDA1177977.1 ROK family protein [Planctomycetota bacterium]
MTVPSHDTAGSAELPLYVGVDVGGTSIKIGLVDSRGQTQGKRSIDTQEERGPESAMAQAALVAQEIVSAAGHTWSAVRAIGLAAPGSMDIPGGLLLQPHNLPHWWDFPLRDELAHCSGKPVAFENDANAAAFGEFWVGTGEKFSSLVMFTLGTGLGCGIIVNELLVDGEHSHGAECGHIIIDYNESARRCGCGQLGHLEAYVSAKAVVERTREALQAGAASPLRLAIERGETLTPRMVAEYAAQGDPLSQQIVLETGRYLGVGVVNLLHTIDPAVVVLGGAMTFGGAASALGNQFLQRVREEVRARAFPTLVQRSRIEFASLGSDAGYIGAAGVARTRALRDQI